MKIHFNAVHDQIIKLYIKGYFTAKPQEYKNILAPKLNMEMSAPSGGKCYGLRATAW